ncbi:PREDICTED: uncharacterized protein LOC108777833 [Cyphomyrmex costatus]|uniref:uncharacterized protein LOC108777833 n=1 Tax=Cyphomyrmex costatus TaxID=456900 RepID=UPI00085221FD|nr:PREDICTED: uncharacterized protein LOC108777833 [Cyphomyrmex costatus]
MILRGLNLLKIAHRSNQSKIAATNLRSVRLCYTGHVYRNIGMAEEKKWVYTAEAFGGLMWWWILWHFWHDFGHIVGEFPYPDPSKWTDEELGIPPDDYESATRIL